MTIHTETVDILYDLDLEFVKRRFEGLISFFERWGTLDLIHKRRENVLDSLMKHINAHELRLCLRNSPTLVGTLERNLKKYVDEQDDAGLFHKIFSLRIQLNELKKLVEDIEDTQKQLKERIMDERLRAKLEIDFKSFCESIDKLITDYIVIRGACIGILKQLEIDVSELSSSKV